MHLSIILILAPLLSTATAQSISFQPEPIESPTPVSGTPASESPHSVIIPPVVVESGTTSTFEVTRPSPIGPKTGTIVFPSVPTSFDGTNTGTVTDSTSLNLGPTGTVPPSRVPSGVSIVAPSGLTSSVVTSDVVFVSGTGGGAGTTASLASSVSSAPSSVVVSGGSGNGTGTGSGSSSNSSSSAGPGQSATPSAANLGLGVLSFDAMCFGSFLAAGLTLMLSL
ncbi:hypothetical protein F5884DRAFT_10947 [Xylogone sp. PMI_703]|nr:hypothetical protein F5884DRAFT_10947 [Xylogone sp. PMI_703]